MSESESEQRSSDVFDVEQIRRLVELMEEKDLGVIDLRQLDQRIKICRGSSPTTVNAAPAPLPVAAPTPAATPSAPAAEPAHIVVIKSPMVGTFYTKPNPDAPVYVNVGDRVSNEMTICIIEAMKVFNEIPAEISGEVVAIFVDNEEPVEYGTPLFKVDTSK